MSKIIKNKHKADYLIIGFILHQYYLNNIHRVHSIECDRKLKFPIRAILFKILDYRVTDAIIMGRKPIKLGWY
jgi:hypothetical protein